MAGIAVDVTERRRSAERQTIEALSWRIQSETLSQDACVSRMLEGLLDTLGWGFAAYWHIDPLRQTIACTHTSHSPAAHAPAFEAACRRARLGRGQELPARMGDGEGVPVWIADLPLEPDFMRAAAAAADGLRAALLVPVLADGQMIGHFELFIRERLPTDRELIATLANVGHQLGQLLRRRQAEESLKERERLLHEHVARSDLEAATLSTFLSTGRAQEAGSVLLRGAMAFTSSQHAFLGVLTGESSLRLLAVEGDGPASGTTSPFESLRERLRAQGHLDVALADNLLGRVARSAEPVIVNAAAEEPRVSGRTPAGHPALACFLAIPVPGERGTIGLLGLANRPGGYAKDHAAYLESVAHFAGVMCESYLDRERRAALESQLRHSQRMEAFGQLAGGVAHDFNNLLTVIGGYAENLFDEVNPADPLRELVTPIRRAADRASSLTRQLLAFSRRQVLQARVLDVNQVVRDVLSMLARLIGEDVSLSTRLAANIPPILADPGQIEQVLLNLVLNARDALPRGGHIEIHTSVTELSAPFCETHAGVRAGPHVEIAVIDDGHGIPPELRSQVFEPFFTTKGPGKGTGLGLATVFGIVQQSQGVVTFESEPGAGTTFRVFLPPCSPAPPTAEAAVPASTTSSSQQTILVVEDDEEVRGLAELMLRRAGFRVILAASGSIALEVLAERADSIDIMLTDVVMPGMSGVALVESARKRWPNLRTLFMSGYTADHMERNRLRSEGPPPLEKPFSSAILVRAIRAVLERP